MSDAPVSPAAKRLASPSWLDTRLVLGVLLVLVSVVVGAGVLSGADRPEYLIYTASRDLAAGVELSEDDFSTTSVALEREQVERLFVSAAEGARPPVGYTTLRSLSEGDPVLYSTLVDTDAFDLRQFTVNVESGHMPPDLTRGQLVDVYVTPDDTAGREQPSAPPRAGLRPDGAQLVFANVPVQRGPAQVRDDDGLGSGGGDAVPVVLNLTPAQVLTMVQAAALGQIDLVRVFGAEAPEPRSRRPGDDAAAAAAAPADATPSPSPTAG